MGIIERIEHEIYRLNREIIDEDNFHGRNGINLNALVCLLRYAAWWAPEELKSWMMRDGCDWDQATINPKIVKRFSLHEPDGDDGAQLRIHIFDDAEDTSKHNHQRSFITMCIQGSYEYRYYRVDEKNGDSPIEFWKRVNGKFEKHRTSKGTIHRVMYSDDNLNSKDIIHTDNQELIFDVNSKPLYVHHEWIHTVHPKNQQEPVITVLIRREKGKEKGKTIFVKGPGDTDFENQDGPRVATLEEIDKMFLEVEKALTGDAQSVEPEFFIDTNVIEGFMLPRSKIARIRPSFLEPLENRIELEAFMELNKFSFTPVTERKNGIERMLKFIGRNRKTYFESKEEWLDPNTPILFGIMYAILSPNYVVPIVDKRTDEFLGMLSLHDIMDNMSRLAGPMIQSSLDSDKGRSVNIYTELLNALAELNHSVEQNDYLPDPAHRSKINTVLAALNKLILDKKLVNLNISDSPQRKEKGTWLEQISGDVFFVGTGCKSPNLLEEFSHTSGFSTFIESVHDNKHNIITISSDGGGQSVEVLKKLDSNATPEDFIKWIRYAEENWPVYIESKTHKRLGIISTDELFSRTGIQQMTEEFTGRTHHSDIQILSRLLLESHQRRPQFNELHFKDVRRLFSQD